MARMSIQAAQKMGLNCVSLDPASITPASQIARSFQGELSDPITVAEIIKKSRHITLENEFIKAEVLRKAFNLANRPESALVPGIETLETIQDKLLQSQALYAANVPAPFSSEISPETTSTQLSDISYPIVLKARYGGYDGKGTRFVKNKEEFEQLRPEWSQGGWMTQAYVPFKRELAVMVYRSAEQTGAFPTMETVQTNHVCDLVFQSKTDASQIAIAAVEAVNGFGLFGVELFETSSNEILVNEIAPRPHNSGHYSLDWGDLSQFDVHIRLCFGIPIPELNGKPTAMANVLGIDTQNSWLPALESTLKCFPNVRFHWYGKSESRPGRKLGHINATGSDAKELVENARNHFLSTWKA